MHQGHQQQRDFLSLPCPSGQDRRPRLQDVADHRSRLRDSKARQHRPGDRHHGELQGPSSAEDQRAHTGGREGCLPLPLPACRSPSHRGDGEGSRGEDRNDQGRGASPSDEDHPGEEDGELSPLPGGGDGPSRLSRGIGLSLPERPCSVREGRFPVFLPGPGPSCRRSPSSRHRKDGRALRSDGQHLHDQGKSPWPHHLGCPHRPGGSEESQSQRREDHPSDPHDPLPSRRAGIRFPEGPDDGGERRPPQHG